VQVQTLFAVRTPVEQAYDIPNKIVCTHKKVQQNQNQTYDIDCAHMIHKRANPLFV
jgi:hypothetical protein